MPDLSQQDPAVKALNGIKLYGKDIKVEKVTPKGDKGNKVVSDELRLREEARNKKL
jgi:hypothetical protein